MSTDVKTAEVTKKSRRGFACWPREKLLATCSAGGKESHRRGTGYEWDRESARKAGAKGGAVSRGGRGALPKDGE